MAAEGAYLAALTTELTPALVQEGLAREFVRRIQDLRKSAGLDISDRIRVRYQASMGLQDAAETYRDYIMNETLAVEFGPAAPGDGMALMTDAFDGEEVTLGLEKA